MIFVLAALAGSVSFPGQEHSFVSYGRIPTWTGVASQLEGESIRVDLYDSEAFPGHADFVSKGLGTGLTFRQFKADVRDSTRHYLPFFVYDLRGQEPTVAGRGRTWAVRVEDYGYADTDETLGRDVLRVAEAVAAHTGFERASGLVVLASSQRVRPNLGSAPVVEAGGWDHTTVSGLQAGEPARFEILNPGEAVGRLRIADPDAPFAPSPRDIVVYDELPARVPPVAAIFTLAPQTPLSHVNLLARNRGTPNVHIASLAVLGASPGDIVQVRAGSDLVVEKVGQGELDAFWSARKTHRLAIPEADRTAGLFDLRQLPTVEQVGAKACNYGGLQKLLPDEVRPGFALGFGAYFEHVERGPGAGLVAALSDDIDGLDADEISARLKEIRKAIRETPVEPELLARLLKLLEREYPGRRVRLRSSTNNEDLPRFNGAGLYVSKGYDVGDPVEELTSDLTKVFASLWSSHAFAERAFYGVDHREVGMAVLIHQAFPDEAATGVVLTVPTKAGVDVLVNSNPGSHSVSNPEPGALPERLRFPLGDPSALVVEGRSSIGPVFAEGFAGSLLPGLAEDAAAIHTWLTERQRARGDMAAYGVDVEFKVVHTPAGLAIFVKQARLLAATSPE